jgi:hypothetical protein
MIDLLAVAGVAYSLYVACSKGTTESTHILSPRKTISGAHQVHGAKENLKNWAILMCFTVFYQPR